MKKVFISQPMSKFTFSEIVENRKNIIEKLKNVIDDDFEVIDNLCEYSEEAMNTTHPKLYYLGLDYMYLANADIAFFAKGWELAGGCLIEHAGCLKEGIECIYE